MRIYQDCTQSAKARAKDLLSIMTIKEKIGQLYQNMMECV